MNLGSLSQKMDVELVVAPVGNAMVLYKGNIEEPFAWAQYDQYTNKIEFVTENGDVQELGLDILEEFKEPLMKVREVVMVRVMDDFTFSMPRLLKFSTLAGERL